jgi:mannose-1-phosphate guanylyltransferase
MRSNFWAVLLAGGNGERLLPLTRRICGDDRPKQFSPLFRNRTLLALTRERVAQVVSPEKTLFAVVESHRGYYEPELADVNPSRIVIQPANRGTSAAIVYSLLRIARTDADAIVAFFPTDHYYADEAAFAQGVELAGDMVRQHPEFLVLMGATPEWADADFGWIEPGSCVRHDSTTSLFRVNRFWEKPSRSVADKLHRNGCLLNTFVMMARAETYMDLLRLTIPEVVRAFALLAEPAPGELEIARRVYRTLVSGDFSHQVLAACAGRLLVLRLADAGWSDLGTEDRVDTVRARHHVHPDAEPRTLEAFHAWLDAYRKRLNDVGASATERSTAAGSRN